MSDETPRPGGQRVRDWVERRKKVGGLKQKMSTGRALVILGDEEIARCTKCGADSWHLIGELRKFGSQASGSRLICANCHGWIYLDDAAQARPTEGKFRPSSLNLNH